MLSPKKILRDILTEYIPEKVFDAPKMGFGVPIKNWIRKELYEQFINVINSDLLARFDLIDNKKIEKMFNAHIEEKADYSAYLWRIFVLQKWLEKNESAH